MAYYTQDQEDVITPAPAQKRTFILPMIPESDFNLNRSGNDFERSLSSHQDVEVGQEQLSSTKRTTSRLLVIVIALAIIGIALGVGLGVHCGVSRHNAAREPKRLWC